MKRFATVLVLIVLLSVCAPALEAFSRCMLDDRVEIHQQCCTCYQDFFWGLVCVCPGETCYGVEAEHGFGDPVICVDHQDVVIP